jgi:hypothetical protein
MLESLESVKRAWTGVTVPALEPVKRAWQSVELEGPTVAPRPPSGVGGAEPSRSLRPSSVSATPALQPSRESSRLAVPPWVEAGVEPWGAGADWEFIMGSHPGLQDIYKELRTTGRQETGGRPIDPKLARALLVGPNDNPVARSLRKEASERSFANPEWRRLRAESNYGSPGYGYAIIRLQEFHKKRAQELWPRL